MRPAAGLEVAEAAGPRRALEAAGLAGGQALAYAGDAYATFVGHERIEGTLGDRTGTFVLQHVGTFEDGVARGAVSVVAGTGTGDLEGLTGDGTFVAERGPTGTVTLELGGTR